MARFSKKTPSSSALTRLRVLRSITNHPKSVRKKLGLKRRTISPKRKLLSLLVR